MAGGCAASRTSWISSRAADACGKTEPLNFLARARKICLALPEAYEKTAWGAPTFRVRDRMFAMYSDNHHGDGRIALWCKAPPGAQEILVAADARHFFVPPYVGTEGWLGIHLDKGLAWGVVAGLVKDGYLEAAARRAGRERARPASRAPRSPRKASRRAPRRSRSSKAGPA